MKNRLNNPLYIHVHINSLQDIPTDGSEYVLEASNTDDIQSAIQKDRSIRAILYSEGLLIGCAKFGLCNNQAKTDIESIQNKWTFLVFYESVVFCPIKKIIEITGLKCSIQETFQEQSVCFFADDYTQLLWRLSTNGIFTDFSLTNHSNYTDYITSLKRSADGPEDHAESSLTDTIIESLCGRRPLKYGCFRKNLLELLNNPDGIFVVRLIFIQGMQLPDLIDFLEDILMDFDAFVQLNASKELFEYLIQAISPHASLLKEMYLVIESSLHMLMKSEAGIALIRILVDNLPEVGKRSMAHALASRIGELANNADFESLIKIVLAENGPCKEAFVKNLEARS